MSAFDWEKYFGSNQLVRQSFMIGEICGGLLAAAVSLIRFRQGKARRRAFKSFSTDISIKMWKSMASCLTSKSKDIEQLDQGGLSIHTP